jgi:SAM-dependent methyltransferase
MSTNATVTPPTPTPGERMFQFFGGLWAARAVHVAAKLGLADHLNGSAKTTEQLATATDTHAPSLYRLLRALASIEIVREDSPGKFVSTELGDMLRTGVPGSFRAAATSILGDEHYQAWEALQHSVQTGETAFDHVFEKPVWKFFQENPSNARTFDQAMTDFTQVIDPAMLKAYDFAQAKRIVDIGGGHGALISAILKQHPAARGTVFDQPYISDGARKALAASGLADRCEAVGGDFFDAVPAGGDLYLMKFIIHDWDDDRSIRILSNIRKAIVPGGKLVLVETVVPEGNQPSFSKFMDLNMLVMTGGRERTEKEYANLFRSAGFKLTRVVPTESVMSVIEAVPV